MVEKSNGIYGTDIFEIYFNIWYIYGLYMNKIVPMYQFDMIGTVLARVRGGATILK